MLDALVDSGITVTVCRHEGGAAMMAEAVGKTTGRPGICFVTRGPGATNASAGIHIAQQDSTPLIMFAGQVSRDVKERGALQELDFRAAFGHPICRARKCEGRVLGKNRPVHAEIRAVPCWSWPYRYP